MCHNKFHWKSKLCGSQFIGTVLLLMDCRKQFRMCLWKSTRKKNFVVRSWFFFPAQLVGLDHCRCMLNAHPLKVLHGCCNFHRVREFIYSVRFVRSPIQVNSNENRWQQKWNNGCKRPTQFMVASIILVIAVGKQSTASEFRLVNTVQYQIWFIVAILSMRCWMVIWILKCAWNRILNEFTMLKINQLSIRKRQHVLKFSLQIFDHLFHYRCCSQCQWQTE